ncbi:MAG: M28 family peptidase [Bacteroidetes bacterium]|nr:M28 family peptidase [Bacteroidota bacterium]MCW5894001.1 M28 family peptidase [Bacteroidota bacterium]
MLTTLTFLLPLLLLFSSGSFSQQKEFSEENAVSILRTLVLEIGPRPMGSPAEQRALNFAAEKFKEYGCDTSYVLPMTVAAGVNTKSGVAVGVKKGKSNRIIVIGGHIDSSGPEIPGANDDGSGTACVIELARVICSRETESTVYFCCWGGEEQGLRGSTFFVNNFEHLDSVVLMLQLDMADGSSYLLADPDGSNASAPSWLVKSAFDIFYHDLKKSDLVYQTASSTLNLAAGGAFGSDHIPFIDKGIPAIDFTSDVTFPIHTPQDNWENFTPSGLKRSGDLVLKLFEKYDGGVPSRTTEQYQLIQFGSQVFFLSYPVIWAFIGISLAVSVAVFVRARKNRLVPDTARKIKWSRFKLIGVAFVLQFFLWSSETVVGLIGGYRFPWVNNESGFLILGALCGLVGLWFVLQAVRRYRLTEDASVFVRPALVSLFVMTLLSAYLTPELGMYLAASLLCMSLATRVKKPALKLILFTMAFLVLYKLVFFDGLGLFQRGIAQNQMSAFWQKALLHLGYVVVFTGLSLPFVYGFAAIYRGSGVDVMWLRRFRKGNGLLVTSLAAVSVATYLLAQPVYDNLWFNNVRVSHHYELGADTSSFTIRSSEYFEGLTGTLNGRDTTLTGRQNYAAVQEARGLSVNWVGVSQSVEEPARISDSTWRVERVLEVHTQFKPLLVNLVYESDQPFEVRSQWAHGPQARDRRLRETEMRKVFRWYSFPDTLLRIPVTFTLRDTQHVTERVEVVFDSVAFPIRLQREFTNVEYRTTIAAMDSFAIAKQ